MAALNTLKKAAALLLALALVAGAAGCKRSNIIGNVDIVIADWRPDQKTGANGKAEPSDINQLDSPAFGPFNGFYVLAWPDDDELTADKFFAVDGWFGQIEYRMADDRLLVVRVARAGGKRIDSTYSESHREDVETFEVDGIEVTEAHGEYGCMLVTWKRGEFQYLLHSGQQQEAPPRALVEKMVSGLDAVDVEETSSGPASG